MFPDISTRFVCVTGTAISSDTLVLVGCFLCSMSGTFSISTVGIISIGNHFTKSLSALAAGIRLLHAQSNKRFWLDMLQEKVMTWFVLAESTIVQFLVFWGRLKSVISVHNIKHNLHFTMFTNRT